jgi:hypothetical protein
VSTLQPQIIVTFTATLTLSEIELRVLDAMAGYGAEEFLKGFYKHLGKAYMEPHEAGVRKLFESIKASVPAQLERVDEARRALRMRPPAGPA